MLVICKCTAGHEDEDWWYCCRSSSGYSPLVGQSTNQQHQAFSNKTLTPRQILHTVECAFFVVVIQVGIDIDRNVSDIRQPTSTSIIPIQETNMSTENSHSDIGSIPIWIIHPTEVEPAPLLINDERYTTQLRRFLLLEIGCRIGNIR